MLQDGLVLPVQLPCAVLGVEMVVHVSVQTPVIVLQGGMVHRVKQHANKAFMVQTVLQNVRVRMVHPVMLKLVLVPVLLDGLETTVRSLVRRANMGSNVLKPATALMEPPVTILTVSVLVLQDTQEPGTSICL